MRRTLVAAVAFAALALSGPAGARAADVIYAVFVDGRPVDRHRDSALRRAGIVYMDVVRAVRAFDGLLTYRGAVLDVTIAGRMLECSVGKRAALLDQNRVKLPGVPFVLHGDTYVPLETIAMLAGAELTLDAPRHRAKLALPPPP